MGSFEVTNREVSWEVLDLPVPGTLTSPVSPEPRGGVILVAGSGPTDRNWCSPMLPGSNGSARLLAEALAAQGFASLRYDKLAAGSHVRENLPRLAGKVSMESHRQELAGAVHALLAEMPTLTGRLFALTNSEGAIHAVNYQLQTPDARFCGFVLTGAPGRAIGEVARSQLAWQGRALPNVSALLTLYDAAIAAFLAGRPALSDPALPGGVRRLIQGLETPANLPFSRELWMYNLPEQLAQLSDPVLVVIGQKDIQIDWKVDGAALERATRKNPQITFRYPPEANHVLKHEETPNELLTAEVASRHYNGEGTALDPEAVSRITEWLRKMTPAIPSP